MTKYQILNGKNKKALKEYLVKEGQLLMPLVESIERSEKALDEVIDEAGRATIEAILELSAQSVAGEKHPGKKGSEVRPSCDLAKFYEEERRSSFDYIRKGVGFQVSKKVAVYRRLKILIEEPRELQDWRYNVGFGLRYDTPLGPLRVDWGFKIDIRPGEPPSRLHVSLGHAF